MGSIPKEIKLMKQIADGVEEAIYKAIYEPKDVCEEELLPWACYLSAVKSLRGIDKVLDFLRYHKPELAEPVEKAYQELLTLATASDQECMLQSLEVPKSAESTLKVCEDYLKRAKAQSVVDVAKIELLQHTETQSKALANKLRHIAQIARKERKHRQLRRICLFITVLAALLTVLYYLGWLEPIKAFIRRVLAHK